MRGLRDYELPIPTTGGHEINIANPRNPIIGKKGEYRIANHWLAFRFIGLVRSSFPANLNLVFTWGT
jgi:hypothetical protein